MNELSTPNPQPFTIQLPKKTVGSKIFLTISSFFSFSFVYVLFSSRSSIILTPLGFLIVFVSALEVRWQSTVKPKIYFIPMDRLTRYLPFVYFARGDSKICVHSHAVAKHWTNKKPFLEDQIKRLTRMRIKNRLETVLDLNKSCLRNKGRKFLWSLFNHHKTHWSTLSHFLAKQEEKNNIKSIWSTHEKTNKIHFSIRKLPRKTTTRKMCIERKAKRIYKFKIFIKAFFLSRSGKDRWS